MPAVHCEGGHLQCWSARLHELSCLIWPFDTEHSVFLARQLMVVDENSSSSRQNCLPKSLIVWMSAQLWASCSTAMIRSFRSLALLVALFAFDHTNGAT
jgi:hypothetical protein